MVPGSMTNRLLLVMLSAASAFALSGCKKEGCLGGEANCRVERPCQKVKISCSATELTVKTITGASERPGGWDGLGSVGDVLLSNGQVNVVLAGIGNQNYIDPNGGSIIDLVPHGASKDGVNGISQAVGILPRDGVASAERFHSDSCSKPTMWPPACSTFAGPTTGT